uniref:Cystatin domain-containing protein n=1 Tax=Heterorhabditis bacteriophora TaxID=37862 RepID=A0A1I7X4L5_HETBA
MSSTVGPLLSRFTPASSSFTTTLYKQIIVAVTDKEVNKQNHDWFVLKTVGVKEDSCADEDDAA